MDCAGHRRVGLEGADRSAAPTTLEPQDDVQGSWFERRLADPSFVISEIADFRRQRVGAAEREGASEVGSVEPLSPDPLYEQYRHDGGVQISTGEPVRFCRATNRILAD